MMTEGSTKGFNCLMCSDSKVSRLEEQEATILKLLWLKVELQVEA